MTDNLFSLWVYLSASPLLGLTSTLVAYQIGLFCAAKTNSHPLVNPVLIAVILLGTALTVLNIPYRQYFEGAQFIHFLLGTATVALAVPFFDRIAQLKKLWIPMSIGLLAGAFASTLVAVLLGWVLGVDQQLILSLVPKSVTAPIAMGISERIGGVPTLSAVFCIITGIIGAASGRIIFNALGIRSMLVRGLALGTAAHGIGTARAYFVSADAGAFAGLALALHGVVAALLLPTLVLWLSR
jgi:predicted murein hydrolase (TIGR00659 family)